MFERIISFVLAATVTLGSGSSSLADLFGIDSLVDQLQPQGDFVRFSQMEYVRPDMDALQASFDAVCLASRENTAREIMDAVYDFYDEYDWFYTYLSLADIHYSADLTDPYWEEEYTFCMENSDKVDALLEDLYYQLAKSPQLEELETYRYFGKDFFDDYQGDNGWDADFLALLEQETQLENEYYTLSEEGLAYTSSRRYYDAMADDMAQLLVDLVRVRNEIAAYQGYDNYADYAYDDDYYRDYTPEEMEDYLADISTILVPVYRQVHETDVWSLASEPCGRDGVFQAVREAAETMGGTVWEAFTLMEQAELYDIDYDPNKYAASFEVFLTSYGEPYVFMNPDGTIYDILTFAHEFGHFANDYASNGSYVGVDVLEFFSQGMEYLLLHYGTDTEDLTRLKLADSLSTYIEQAAYGSFEHRLYNLPEEQLNPQGLYDLYEQVSREYGFEAVGYDPREFVDITHFYTNPMYVVSYIVSNDAAMQLYQLEAEEQGSGLALMEENLDTYQDWFLAFLEEAELESPFAPGRLEDVRRTFEEALLGA